MTSVAEIDNIRLATRVIVRELGFMNATLAETSLSPSGVHALIEIGNGIPFANDLAKVLRLEKSSVSRLIKNLVFKELVSTSSSAEDGRQKKLTLTQRGEHLVRHINSHGRQQVKTAFASLSKREARLVKSGLEKYAVALTQEKTLTTAPTPKQKNVEIACGYHSALLGRIVTMHAQFYSQHYGFGSFFEAKVATEMAEFLTRLDHPMNEVWVAISNNNIIGSISIDGEDLENEEAHLRWFIIDEDAQGTGIGKELIASAMKFVDSQGFKRTRLWTFEGLDAARKLYEREGFVLENEQMGMQWGTSVNEQEFVR